MKTINSARLALALGLAASTGMASATTMTYSFTGGGEGSYQQVYNYTTNSAGTVISSNDTGPTPNATGSMSFTVDASVYLDEDPEAGITFHEQDPPPTPWLTSTSSFSGPLFPLPPPSVVDTIGARYSYLYADSDSPYFEILDEVQLDPGTYTYDGERPLTYTVGYALNNVYFDGDVTLGLVDGQQLPIALGTAAGTLAQSINIAVTTYTSWDGSNPTDYTTQYTTYLSIAPILTAEVSPVPEAGTYAMMLAGLGLVGVAARRRRV